MNLSAVYWIFNKVNGKMYIGMSRDCAGRWYEHLRALKARKHHNQLLQRAWDKYGSESFKFEVLREAPVEELVQLEEQMIELFGSADHRYGYNILAAGEVNPMDNPVTRQKHKKSTQEVWSRPGYKEFHVQRMRNGREKHIDKIKEARENRKAVTAFDRLLARQRRQEANKLIGRVGNKHFAGKVQSVGARIKMSLAQIGKKRGPRKKKWVMTPEQRAATVAIIRDPEHMARVKQKLKEYWTPERKEAARQQARHDYFHKTLKK